ncbi:hypothetical protein PG5_04000 [Pseudomonas sp. G5(2012)]|nr:hypothetical protein PG5_04000 [Pseudomonas sp. G5(2012)]
MLAVSIWRLFVPEKIAACGSSYRETLETHVGAAAGCDLLI